MPNYTALSRWLKTLAAESYLKLGMKLPGLQLNEPPASLCRLLEIPQSEMEEGIQGFPGLYEPGDVVFGRFEDNITMMLCPDAVAKAVEEPGENSFLRELVALSGQSHSTCEDFHRLMEKHGETVWLPASDAEFDYLGYFAKGEPDDFRYCFHREGDKCDYHRYTKADYEAFEWA